MLLIADPMRCGSESIRPRDSGPRSGRSRILSSLDRSFDEVSQQRDSVRIVLQGHGSLDGYLARR